MFGYYKGLFCAAWQPFLRSTRNMQAHKAGQALTQWKTRRPSWRQGWNVMLGLITHDFSLINLAIS